MFDAASKPRSLPVFLAVRSRARGPEVAGPCFQGRSSAGDSVGAAASASGRLLDCGGCKDPVG
jgi:hypothetical protein